MSTINQLSSIDTVSSGDQLPVFSVSNGRTRSLSISSLLSYFQQTFASPTMAVNLYVPSTGFSITVPTPVSQEQWILFQPVATLATGTITLPLNTSTADGTSILFTSTQSILVLTVLGNGATAVFGPSSYLNPFEPFKLRYYKATNSWYRISG
jgi:hypothetical protein